MATTPAPDDDDDDSVYSDSAAAPQPSDKAARETVLDAAASQHVDAMLDEEDAAFDLANPDAAAAGAYDSDGVVPASGNSDVEADELDDDDDDLTPRATQVEELPTPPRAPSPAVAEYEVHADRVRGSRAARWEAGESNAETEVSDLGIATVDADEDDDWFDSDENKVDVESLESSDSSSGFAAGAGKRAADASQGGTGAEASARKDGVPNGKAAHEEKKGGSGGGSGGLSLLTRASHTFYKAFKKTTKKASTTESSSNVQGGKRGGGDRGGQEQEELEQRHARLEHLLSTQIATLDGARSGFVDLRLLRPMTERTLEAVELDAKALLGDFGAVERRAREAGADAGKEREEGEKELQAKEQMLIAAKVRLAEAAAEVDGLRHELRSLQRELGRPERVAARKREEGRRTRERLRAEAVTVAEARAAAERRLGERRRSLGRERTQLERLESGYRDIEGDWA